MPRGRVAAKTPAKKPAPKKIEKKKVTTPVVKAKRANPESAVLSKAQRVRAVMDAVNTAMKTEVVTLASESDTSYLLRRPVGMVGMDIGLGGGFAAGALNVIVGPDGVGKDYLMNCAIREIQKNYGDESAVAIYTTEFKYDKDFARKFCGVRVAYTEEEIAEKQAVRMAGGMPAFTDEELADLRDQVGSIVLIQGVIAEHGLDVVIDFVGSNEFQLVAINSLGVLETAAKDNTESLEEFPQQSNEAVLLGKFMSKLFMRLNSSSKSATGSNKTTILAINQVRAKRDQQRGRPGMPVPEKSKYQAAAAAHSVKHGKAVEVFLHKGSMLLDESTKPMIKMGFEVQWELSKGKLGTHDGIKGSYKYYYDEEYGGPGADILADLYSTAVVLGVLEQSGAWVTYQHPEHGFHANGEAKARVLMRNSPETVEALRHDCLKAAGVFCRYK